MHKNYKLAKQGVNYQELMTLLKDYFGAIPFNGRNTFINTPVIVNPNLLDQYSKLCSILNDVIKNIVLNYFEDNRIRNCYQLDGKLESILHLAKGVSYEVGMYRPDFIFDNNGQAKICEIGCRYPINGWMVSHYTKHIFSTLQKNTIEWSLDNYHFDITKHILKTINNSEPLVYVHHLEKGTETHQLFDELKKEKQDIEIIDCSPNDLKIINGKLTLNQRPAVQFILEMDREELKNISPEILNLLIHSKCINDVRSLILVHDKNILSVLYNDAIVKDYCTEKEHAFLKQFLIPSYTLNSENIRATIINSKQNWILKKSSGGRGLDMYIKDDCDAEVWENIVTHEWKNYMVQNYIEQTIFSYKKDNHIQNLNLVGMLLCYNKEFCGLGVFRGSTKRIINVHSGGYILPAVFSKM